MSSKDETVRVLAASYDSVEEAEADYEAVKKLYEIAGTGHHFDAAVIQRDESGKSHVVRKHEQPTRHGALVGLAIGAVSAILPGIGLLAGGALGAGIGALTGHLRGGLSNKDLKQLGEVLDSGQAGLVVVYASNDADQVKANVKAVKKYISEELDANAEELAGQIKAAEHA
ncbi:DUF1269 domain-containing protein [Pseudonocardia acidicola]|uniref:DUF1269 domain-containing protein n=1 Tax=Pseudonocardia acidicola TaxID=2724939 RepID=A0ABX1SI06_9PSEU|nr:DUF1269 domain-containing protein [Pseudonocardia acidicola]NMI01202.1 DUF1269 domain-containing protein [Pseudonocardia acidicola]